jgi:hypothetical protein
MTPGTGALRIEPAVEAKVTSGTAGALPLLPWPTAGGASSPVSPASNVAGPVGGVTGLAGGVTGLAGAFGAGRGDGEAGTGPALVP